MRPKTNLGKETRRQGPDQKPQPQEEAQNNQQTRQPQEEDPS